MNKKSRTLSRIRTIVLIVLCLAIVIMGVITLCNYLSRPKEAKTPGDGILIDLNRESEEVYIFVISLEGEMKCAQITQYAKEVLTWPSETEFFSSLPLCESSLTP